MLTSITSAILLVLMHTTREQNFHSNFNGYYSDNNYNSGSNNEFAELVSIAYENHLTSQQSKRVQALRHVIGHFPFAEQIALIETIDSDTTYMFSKPDYLKSIRYPNRITSDDNYIVNFFSNNSVSISTYITESVKRLSSGLGCFKRISNKYGYNSSIDKSKLGNIYSAINDIIRAQTQANYCTANFLYLLQNKMIQRRNALFTLKNEHIKVDPDESDDKDVKPNEHFVYENENVKALTLIIGIKYTNKERDDIVDGFKTYATCQHIYNNILHTKAMDIVIEIGQLRSCIDRDKPNIYAGNSSTVSGGSNDEDKKTMIRLDQRTTNNFYLNWGFKLGQAQYSDNNQVVQSYSGNFNKEFFTKILESLNPIKDNNEVENVITLLKEIYPPSKTYRPYSNLHSAILNTENIVDSNEQVKLNQFIFYLKQIEKKTFEKYIFADETPKLFVCHNQIRCECINNDCPIELDDLDFLINDLSDDHKNTNFYFSTINIYLIFRYNDDPILITEAENPVTGKVFDIYYKGNGLGNLTMSITQSCFGVFTSGAKNDKDACRDTLTEHCGTDLDYNCKKSGFYDFINESPVLSNGLPDDCSIIKDDNTLDKDKCFQWIDKYFIAGTITVKPSSFISYNLNAQSSIDKGSEAIFDKEHYKPADFGSTLTDSDDFKSLFEDIQKKKMIYVFQSTAKYNNNDEDSSSIQILETDKGNMLLQLSSSTYIPISNKVNVIIIIGMIIIFIRNY